MSHLQAQWGFRKPRNICLCEKRLWPLKLVKKSLVLALPPKSATSYEKNCSGRWRHMWKASLAFWHKNHLSRHSLNFLFLYIRCSFFGTELLLIDEIGFCIWYVERQESWWSPWLNLSYLTLFWSHLDPKALKTIWALHHHLPLSCVLGASSCSLVSQPSRWQL